MIKSYNLCGQWDFALDQDKQGIKQHFYEKKLEDSISLPGTTSMAKKGTYSDKKETGFLTDPYAYEGYAWYSKEIVLDESEVGKNIWLYLERTRMTKVWVDDVLVGEGDSLNTPHQYNLTTYVKTHTFRLTILVSNVDYKTKGGHLTSPDTQTNWNGIIGEISLRIYETCYISGIRTFPDVETKTVQLEITTCNTTNTTCKFPIVISAHTIDKNGDVKLESKPLEYAAEFVPGTGKISVKYPLGENAIYWSEYCPVIYELEITIPELADKTETTFGLRRFATDEKQFLINGVPTFLRGKHDGLLFPMTGAVPTDVKEWIRVMSISKSYGINHYRFHTCCPPDAAFMAADLLGIYMEPQLPFWGTLSGPEEEEYNAKEQEYLIAEGYRMMETFGNHASYCMMSLGNELWGNKDRMAEIIRNYRAVDDRHLYTQGSNNFQHTPVILPEEDFIVGVRLSKNRLYRGSYGMCDAPLGHVQTEEPSTRHNYDEAIHPSGAEEGNRKEEQEIEIQYGTGVKKVKAANSDGILIPHVPVVSHEIGQYAVYPNFREIEKYTGVLKARNLEVFKERLEKKGMLDQADDFFYASGKLSVACYKEELEAAARSSLIAGYQILDIQDFSGQGTALVGILDAFMDSKGHVTPEEWSGFCSDGILLSEFDKYMWEVGETFQADMAIRYYNPVKLEGKSLHWEITVNDSVMQDGDITIPDGAFGLQPLGGVEFMIPEVQKPAMGVLTLTVAGTSMKNTYELYFYPSIQEEIPLENEMVLEKDEKKVHLTHDFKTAEYLLEKGEMVLYLPNEVKEKIQGFYCTDFWCYPMFRDISEWMHKPVAVGTMGLLLEETHPLFREFPTHKYATPQWYQIVSHSDCAILEDVTEKGYHPIVQMVDNFERNHKLGIVFEGKVETGKLLVCTSRLSEISDRCEVKQFVKAMLDYVMSDAFAPEKTLDMKKLEKIFV